MQWLSSLLTLAVCWTCVTYEASKKLTIMTLTIIVSVSLYSTLSSLLIQAVCRTFDIYEPIVVNSLVALPSVSPYRYAVLFHHC